MGRDFIISEAEFGGFVVHRISPYGAGDGLRGLTRPAFAGTLSDCLDYLQNQLSAETAAVGAMHG